jgi:D-aspartate ligase
MMRPKTFIFKGAHAPFHHGALAVARTLGRLGVQIAANDELRRAPTSYSRYRAETLVWDPWPTEPEALVERLLDWGRKQETRSFLVAVDDTATIAVDDFAADLEKCFLIPKRSPGLGRSLSDKWTMAELAQAHGVPTPRVARVESASHVEHVLADLGLPVVVKRTAGWSAALRGVPSVTLARTREEVDELGRAGWENFILQEFIPGGSTTSWMFNGYFDEQSRCLFGLTGYKLRQFPLNGGFTTLGRLEPNDDMLRTAVDFFSNVGYVGIIDVGFRYDARDGSYKLLDVNPRVGSTFRLFVDDEGRDVVRVAYADLAGEATGSSPGTVPPQATVASPRTWSVEPHDAKAGFGLVRRGRTSAWKFVRSTVGVDEHAWWAADDLKPFVAAMARGFAVKRPHLHHDHA